MSDVEFVDRIDPSKRRDYLSCQHVERYRFACQNLKSGQWVLDIACGTGYGTALMLQSGCNVTGADIDDDVLKEARIIWNHDGFVKADVLDLPFENESFDAVVSFETIEHVVDGDRFLSEMSRVLKPGGVFICSTPNIKYTAHPAYHVKEYIPDEFFRLVEHYFSDVHRYGQYFTIQDRLRDLLRWRVRNNLVKLLGTLKLKHIVKTVLRNRTPKKVNQPEPLRKTAGGIDNTEAKFNASDTYSVKTLRGENLLRIMLIKGRKT